MEKLRKFTGDVCYPKTGSWWDKVEITEEPKGFFFNNPYGRNHIEVIPRVLRGKVVYDVVSDDDEDL